jgi:2-polyprenyl-6-methoxyphenol hydroxylase-like FAD-dependent oxidoreductase
LDKTGLKVSVIGAGIGGLTAAIALRQAGIECEIYEKTARLEEIGAAIALWPNATRVLKNLGVLQSLLERSDLIEHCEIRSWDDSLLKRWRIPSLETPAIFTHRADLQAVLVSAVGLGSVRLGKGFLTAESDGRVTRLAFTDGSEAFCDLLIGADGLRSKVREILWGFQKPVYQGYTMWRAVIPLTHPVLKSGGKIEWWGRGVRFGIAQTGQGRLNWYAACGFPENRKLTGEASKAYLLEKLAAWAGPVREILEATQSDKILQNDILALPPTGRWGRGNITLLGDAAHPTSPNLGQGAGMAIEDSAVLADDLARHGIGERALRAYEKRRRKRTASMTRRSKFVGEMGQWSHPLAVALRTAFLRSYPRSLMEKQLESSYRFQGG